MCNNRSFGLLTALITKYPPHLNPLQI